MKNNPIRPNLKQLCILGHGNLGLSLAQWAAECGLEVVLVGRSAERAAQGLASILRRWEGSLRKGRLNQEALSRAQALLRSSGDLEAAIGEADVFLEAIPESLELKATLWKRLAPLATPAKLWATGSSGIPVSEIRGRSGFSCPILGFHLFVPVQHHRVLELVSEDGCDQAPARALAHRLQLEVVEAPDQVGYLASRLAMAQGLEAMRMVEQGQGSPTAIDALMCTGYGHPCGPLELSDRVGLDLRLAIASALFEQTASPLFLPPAILRAKVARGELGRKSGQGFYTWPKGSLSE